MKKQEKTLLLCILFVGIVCVVIFGSNKSNSSSSFDVRIVNPNIRNTGTRNRNTGTTNQNTDTTNQNTDTTNQNTDTTNRNTDTTNQNTTNQITTNQITTNQNTTSLESCGQVAGSIISLVTNGFNASPVNSEVFEDCQKFLQENDIATNKFKKGMVDKVSSDKRILSWLSKK